MKLGKNQRKEADKQIEREGRDAHRTVESLISSD
jgi:hypothetical protein